MVKKLRKKIKTIGATLTYLLTKRTTPTLIFLGFLLLLIALSVKTISCDRKGVHINMRDKLPLDGKRK